MKVLVISDTHDNIVRLKHVLSFIPQIGVEAIIHCGDWATPSVAEIIGRVGVKKFGVLGNADIDPEMVVSLKKNNIIFDLNFLKLTLDRRKIGIAHYPPSPATSAGAVAGHAPLVAKRLLQDALNSEQYDALFYGHRHSAQKEVFGKTLLARPGALGRTNHPSFGVYDSERNDVEFVDVAL